MPSACCSAGSGKIRTDYSVTLAANTGWPGPRKLGVMPGTVEVSGVRPWKECDNGSAPSAARRRAAPASPAAGSDAARGIRVSAGFPRLPVRGRARPERSLIRAARRDLRRPGHSALTGLPRGLGQFRPSRAPAGAGTEHAAGAGPAGPGQGWPGPDVRAGLRVDQQPSIRTRWTLRTPNPASARPPGTCTRPRTWCRSSQRDRPVSGDGSGSAAGYRSAPVIAVRR